LGFNRVMQNNITLFETKLREPLIARQDAVPVRRWTLRGDRNYLRALRAAEMAVWQSVRPTDHPPRVPLKAHSRCWTGRAAG
jgi:hypothetical protein